MGRQICAEHEQLRAELGRVKADAGRLRADLMRERQRNNWDDSWSFCLCPAVDEEVEEVEVEDNQSSWDVPGFFQKHLGRKVELASGFHGAMVARASVKPHHQKCSYEAPFQHRQHVQEAVDCRRDMQEDDDAHQGQIVTRRLLPPRPSSWDGIPDDDENFALATPLSPTIDGIRMHLERKASPPSDHSDNRDKLGEACQSQSTARKGGA